MLLLLFIKYFCQIMSKIELVLLFTNMIDIYYWYQ